jgi:hypothetical protein
MSLILLMRSNMALATDPGEIVTYHCMTHFTPCMGLAPIPWDNLGFAFLGDMIPGQLPPMVLWDHSYFHTIKQTRMPTIAALDQTLAAQPNTKLVGSFRNNDAGTELLRTRHGMSIPTKYVPMVLGMGLSPKNAWLRIRGSMEAQGKMLACAPFINWLRLAMTSQAANLPSCLVVIAHPAAPGMPAPANMTMVLGYCWQLVSPDIPVLNTVLVAQGAHNIAQGLTMLVSKQKLASQEDLTRWRTEKNKNLSSYFENDVLRLLRWCHIQDKSLLPDIWKQLTNTPKGQY